MSGENFYAGGRLSGNPITKEREAPVAKSKSIPEIQEYWKKEFDVELSDTKAETIANNVLRLLKCLKKIGEDGYN